MKNAVLSFLFLFLSFLLSAQENPNERPSIFSAAVILGFNGTQVDGDNVAGYYKFGLNGGAGAWVRFHPKFSGSFELLYSQQGARSIISQSNPSYNYRLWLDYVEVPFLANFHDRERAIFSLGVSVGRLVRFKEEINFLEQLYDRTPYTPWALNGVGNITFIFKEHYGINMRFAYSLLSIRTFADSPLRNKGQYHNILSLRGMYIF